MAAETECLLKWIMFFDNLFITQSKPTSSSTSKGSPQLQIMKLDEAIKIAKRCGLTDEEDMVRALEFFHKQGLALYFNEETLKDIIFLNPKHLVDAFRTIITFNTESPFPFYSNEITTFQTCGRLSRDTMKRIWDGQKYTEETQKYLGSLQTLRSQTFWIWCQSAMTESYGLSFCKHSTHD